MMCKLFAFLLASIFIASVVHAEMQQSSEKWLKLKSGKYTRDLLVHLPPVKTSNEVQALPVVLNFHPMAMDPESWKLESNFLGSSDKAGFIVVYPRGAVPAESISALVPGFPKNWLRGNATWNGGSCCPSASRDNVDDVQFAKDLVAFLRGGAIKDMSGGSMDVDPNRIYSAGGSNGAFMTLRLACEAPELFAAVAAVAGVLANATRGMYPHADPAWPFDSFECAQRSRPVPTLIYQGTWDPLVIWDGEPIMGFRSAQDNLEMMKGLNGIPRSAEGSVSYHYDHATCTAYGESASNVTLCKMEEMGHAWPSNGAACWASKFIPGSFCSTDSDASVEVVEFFKRYALPAQGIVV